MNIKIANRLVELRKKHNLSQEELASKLGVSRQAVSKWERAESSPDTDNLISLAKLYNKSLDELLLNDENTSDIKENSQNEKDTVIIINSDNNDDQKYNKTNFWLDFPYTILIVIIFFITGLVWDLWHIAWTFFITIPIYYSLIRAIKYKNIYYFTYPVFVVFIYLLASLIWDLWGKLWIIFITIPLYYGIIRAVRKSRKQIGI